jgi:YHYH protein
MRVATTKKLGLAAICVAVAAFSAGCGSGGGSGSTGSTTNTSSNEYIAAYNAVSWGSTMTVTYPTNCEMTIRATGKPDYTPNPYYLAPASGADAVVAHTVETDTPLTLISYANVIEPSLQASSITINICPAKAASTTATGGGAIGYLISGTAMFDPYEMDASTAALSDNGSYTFVDGSGTTQTAYFLDQCGSHSNGTTWHAHGNPDCVTSQVDTATGPSHIIGVALDGFPIYGGRDINGNVIEVSQLDACNGITSATPEFPNGAYHYVLPIGVANKYSSLNCFSGTVSEETMAAARKLACNMKAMFAMIRNKQGDSQKMAGMAMPAEAIARSSAIEAREQPRTQLEFIRSVLRANSQLAGISDIAALSERPTRLCFYGRNP